MAAMDSAVTTESDQRCGTPWLQQLDPSARNGLLAPLLGRFNHDLRTPLNTILGWTHLLQKGELDAVRARHVADVIARNSCDQTQLLEEFVDDGRAVLGVLQLQVVPLSIDDVVVTQAIERVAGILTLHGVFLQSKLGAADTAVNGDLRRLTRLVYRLLATVARRAREASTVEIKSEIDDANYELSLSVSGSEPDWSEAALLDLRISTLMAALHDGELYVDADATRPCIQLRLPRLFS